MNNKMKNILLVVLGTVILIIGIYAGNIYLQKNESGLPEYKSPLPENKSAVVTSPETADINARILKDIVGGVINCDLEDENGNISKDHCSVDKVTGNFAKGSMPRAYWMAVKIKDKWQVVLTGNGIPTCGEIDEYSIPREIYGNCIETSGQLRF